MLNTSTYQNYTNILHLLSPLFMHSEGCNFSGLSADSYTLQKQVGCFNHRMVTMVADKAEETVNKR